MLSIKIGLLVLPLPEATMLSSNCDISSFGSLQYVSLKLNS